MILKAMNFYLSGKLEADSQYLPLTEADMNALKTVVPEGEETILTLAYDLKKEYVKAKNVSGTILLERGLDSTPSVFPKGSCLYFENSVPVTKWLICNYECCTGECPVDPVGSAGVLLPDAKVGNAWEGSFVFSGDLPMQFGVTGMPSWMTATYAGNYVKLSGTPVAAGTFSISVAASNDMGKNIAVAHGTVTVE